MQPPNTSRKKKFLAMLPMLALPFCCLLFYALGGGGPRDTGETASTGLNSLLPSPSEEQKTLDKLSLYNKVAADSAHAREQEMNTPFSIFPAPAPDLSDPTLQPGQVVNPFSLQESSPRGFGNTTNTKADQSEQQLNQLAQKLHHIQQMLDTAPQGSSLPPSTSTPVDPSPELDRLESIMTAMKDSPAEDLEMAKMSGMLDKILDIQHPERVSTRLKDASIKNQGKVYPVSVAPNSTSADYFGMRKAADTTRRLNPTDIKKNVFYDDAPLSPQSDDAHAAVQAVIHESQMLVTGATVKIRLQQPIYIDGQLIDKGNFVFGECSLSGERLMIEISSIRNGSALFPVRLSVFDLDGNPGIRIPGSITRDASKQSTDQAVQSLALSSMDASIGAQAAAAGIETAKGLLSKKVRLIRVTVKSDYPVLLQSAQ